MPASISGACKPLDLLPSDRITRRAIGLIGGQGDAELSPSLNGLKGFTRPSIKPQAWRMQVRDGIVLVRLFDLAMASERM